MHRINTPPAAPNNQEDSGQIALMQPQRTSHPLLDGRTRLRHAWYLPVKAALDFLVSLVLLVLSAPIVLLAAGLIKLTSRGPAFYRQARLGKNGRHFTLYKLRSMIDDAEKLTGPIWAEVDDSRVTSVGRLLRHAHIDELPQLVNVLLGQMSLIGPRPERPELTPELEEEIPRYRDRLCIRPGITGLAQLRLPPDLDLASVRRKLAYDLYYVRYVGPILDAKIALFTCLRLVHDAITTGWGLFALPHWETVERHAPTIVSIGTNWGALEEAGSPDAKCTEPSAQDSSLRTRLTKPR